MPAREGSGRKPKEQTLLRRKIIAERIEDAEYAFEYIVGLLRNPKTQKQLRVSCANAVLDRVLGKPKQVLAGAPNEPIEIKTFDYGTATSVIAPRPGDDSPASGQDQSGLHGPPLGEDADGG